MSETTAPADALYDLTIIGGGPAGMYAAFYSGMRDMKTKLIEARPELGGRLLVYPEKKIWDVGGIACIRGEDLIRQLREQALHFQPTLAMAQQVTELSRQDDGTLLLTTACGQRHYTRTLLLAAGRGVVSFNKLKVAGAARFEAHNLHYTITDSSRFAGKHVLISGGGDTAVDWANDLADSAAKVTLVHRRTAFSAHEASVRRMREQKVEVLAPFVVHQLHGSNRIETAELMLLHEESGQPVGTPLKLEVDEVIVSHGRFNDLGPLAAWPLEIDDEAVVVDSGMLTNLPGVYAAGDLVEYDNKLRLIAGAFTEAAIAVNSAKLYLEPDAHRQAYVSSHNEKFTL